ncbi:hypothetical protein OLT23_00010, partial [Campylobacter jejuni]|nr:hypothetical protein [Campylobacter jejuni]
LEDGKTSISYLQRRLKIGYNRSANIIEQLTQNGVLSEPDAKGQKGNFIRFFYFDIKTNYIKKNL